jgi:hypothetical protein
LRKHKLLAGNMDFDSRKTRHWPPKAGNESGPAGPEPDLFRPHPNLADVVNSNIVQAEIAGGVTLDGLPAGTELEVETQHRYYAIEYRGDGKGIISGHPLFCPVPTLVQISGSTWGGSMLWTRFVGREMHLEFVHPVYGRITTSRIADVRVVDEDHPRARDRQKSHFRPELN